MKALLFSLVILISFGAIAQDNWPQRMEFDTQHEPFLHGVASGDPLTDRVIIWSRITPPSNSTESFDIQWEIAIDSNFLQVVNSGTFTTDSTIDYTIKIDADGLQPNFTYWYRFKHESFYSAVGRTKTAPSGNTQDHLRFGVCYGSSIYSGYMNAYRQIAQRDDLHGIIHMGDYVYEFVDTDEQVRVPSDFPYLEGVASPSQLDEWRYIHNIYHMDVDFREALHRHPLMVIWDNHDINQNDLDNSIKAFWEWTPTRMPNPSDSTILHRKFQYGDLMDLYFVDMWGHKDEDTPNALLGNEQNSWLKNELQNSTAQWHILAEQKPMGGFQLVAGVEYNQDKTWDGYPSEREAFYNFLIAHNIDNTVVLSGDAHLTIAMDLIKDGLNVGCELLPASITRGNLDEMGYGAAAGVAEAQALLINSHHIYNNFIEQGYAVLDVNTERAIAEMYYCDILNYTDNQSLGKAFRSNDGSNRWTSDYDSSEPTIGNNDPIDIDVTNLIVSEGESEGFVITNLTATDPDADDTHQFGLADNSNGRFKIEGNQLMVNNSFSINYENQTSHSITIFTVDNKGGYYEENFNVFITNVNEAPYNIELSDTLFVGSQPSGTNISTIITSDQDLNETHTYEFVSGPGDEHNNLFLINGDQIALGMNFQNVVSVYNVRIRVTDSGNNTYEEAFKLYNSEISSTEEISEQSQFLIYPNPAKESFIVLINNDYAGPVHLNIYSTSGKLVRKQSFNKKSSYLKKSVDISDIASGEYIIKIEGEDFFKTINFSVK